MVALEPDSCPVLTAVSMTARGRGVGEWSIFFETDILESFIEVQFILNRRVVQLYPKLSVAKLLLKV